MIRKEDRNRLTILNLFGIRDVSEHSVVLDQLKNGLDIDTVDSSGRTILMEAVIRTDHDLTKLLIQNGANVNIRDTGDWTALHFAAQNSDKVAAKLLIDAGADVHAKESFGNNVIWRAVFDARGGLDLLKLLISHGADSNDKNDSGISAMDLALRIGDRDLIETLASYQN